MDALKLTDDERQQIGDIREQGFTLNFLQAETFAAANSFFQSEAAANPLIFPFPCLIQRLFISGMITGGSVSRVIRPENIRLQLTELNNVTIGSMGFDHPSLFGALAVSWANSQRLVINGINSGQDLSDLGLITKQFNMIFTIMEEVSIGETSVITVTVRLKRAS